MNHSFCLAAIAAIFTPIAVTASPIIQLDFEGLASRAAINDFYNGGTDSAGDHGTNYGVAFGSNALALAESDPAANFSREPSPQTVLFFLTGTAILNYAPGFDGGFSFYYSAVNFSGSVKVYDGLDARGTLLGNIVLPALGAGPDPLNPYSIWQIGSLAFGGVAKSIDFGGTVNQVGYDNITFGSTDPRSMTIPEPAVPAMVALGGIALLVGRLRRGSNGRASESGRPQPAARRRKALDTFVAESESTFAS